jgi:putative transposase
VKYRDKFHLDSSIISYLKYICFKIDIKFSFDFSTIGMMVIMHIFSLVEPKYFPPRVTKIIKNIPANKIFKEHSEVKKQLSDCEL